MHLTRVSIRGLKAATDYSLDIHPLQAVFGPNGTGKSTVRQAVELLCLGHIIGGGKTNALVWRLAGGDGPLEVVGWWEDGGQELRFARSWARDNGSVSSELAATGARGKKAAEAAFSSYFAGVAPLLELDEWLAMSSDKRRERLFQVASDTAVIGLPSLSAAVHDARQAVGSCLALPAERGHSLDTWVAAALTLARETSRRTKAEIASLGAVLDDLRVQLAAAARPSEAVQLRIAELVEQRESLRQQAAEEGARERLRRERDQLLDRRAVLEGRVLEIPDWRPLDLARAEDAAQAAELELEASTIPLVELEMRIDDLLGDRSKLTERLDAKRAQVEHYRDGRCPMCGQSVTGLVGDLLEAEVLELVELVDTVAREHSAAVAEHGRLSKARLAAIARLDQQRQALTAIQTAQRRTQDAEAMRSEAVQLGRQIEAIEARLHALGDATSVRETLDRVNRELAHIEESVGSYDQLARRVTNTERELEVAEQRLEAAESLRAVLGPRGVQGRIAEGIVGPLVEAANALVGSAGLGRLEAVLEDDQGRPILDLRLVRVDDGGSPIDGLSGGEAAVVHAALAVGFARVTGARWRPLIVDSLEALDQRRRQDFLCAAQTLQTQGVVDQVLVLGCPDVAAAPEGWAVAVLS